MLSISVNKNLDYSTPIMFVPLGVPTITHTQIATPKKTIPKKTAVQVKPTIEKKVAAAPIKKPTTVAAIIPKKIEEKKITPPTTAVDVKKVEEKKEIPKVEIAKKIEPIVQQPSFAKALEGRPTPETSQPPIAQALDIEQPVVPVIPENAQISHNYREVEALRRGAQLQKELIHKWKPPIGVSPECTCEISFFVNPSGKIEDLKMVKSSGVVMYDISARQALFAMTMPQWTHGKPLIISFKQ